MEVDETPVFSSADAVVGSGGSDHKGQCLAPSEPRKHLKLKISPVKGKEGEDDNGAIAAARIKEEGIGQMHEQSRHWELLRGPLESRANGAQAEQHGDVGVQLKVAAACAKFRSLDPSRWYLNYEVTPEFHYRSASRCTVIVRVTCAKP